MATSYDQPAYIGLDDDAIGSKQNGLSQHGSYPQDEFSPAPPPKVSKLTQVVYGIGEIGIWASAVIQGFYLIAFLLEVAGIDPGIVR